MSQLRTLLLIICVSIVLAILLGLFMFFFSDSIRYSNLLVACLRQFPIAIAVTCIGDYLLILKQRDRNKKL